MIDIDAVPIIDLHRCLLADRGRTESYQKAILQTVRPGDVVVDIGTGSGILAFFACQAGARKVYAIEMSPAVEMARELCARNGFEDRVVFVNEASFHTNLPEKVDVIVTETGGIFGLQGGLLGLVLDARKRFLKEGGRVIPHSLELAVVPVEAAKLRGQIDFWKAGRYGVDFSAISPYAVNNCYGYVSAPEHFLGDPRPLVRIPISEVESSYVVGSASCVATRSGVLDGIAGWLNQDLAPGITISNSPCKPNTTWAHAIFPIEASVDLAVGDGVATTISTNDGAEWRWQVRVTRNTEGKEGAGAQPTRFDHSSFFGFPLTRQKLATASKPKLSRRGQAEMFLLSLLNGGRTIADLEQELTASYGDAFPSPAALLAFVKDVARRAS